MGRSEAVWAFKAGSNEQTGKGIIVKEKDEMSLKCFRTELT
jgi:hypothetical protein